MAMVTQNYIDMQTDTHTHPANTLAEIQVTYSSNIPKDKRIKIVRSSDVVRILRDIWEPGTIEYREQFYVLYLSRNNDVLGYLLHSMGGVAGTTVDAKQILAVALKANASSIILAHNHPSSNLRPSAADTDITQKIVSGASLLDVSVLDHIILTQESYFSFADEGIMPVSNKGKTYVD